MSNTVQNFEAWQVAMEARHLEMETSIKSLSAIIKNIDARYWNGFVMTEENRAIIELTNAEGLVFQPFPASMTALWNMTEGEQIGFLNFYGYDDINRDSRRLRIYQLLGVKLP
jgi:hypothetical protein